MEATFSGRTASTRALRYSRPSLQQYRRTDFVLKAGWCRQIRIDAGLGIRSSFSSDDDLLLPSDELEVPSDGEFGLTTAQMRILGMTSTTKQPVRAEHLSARNFYAGDPVDGSPIGTANIRYPTTMSLREEDEELPDDLPTMLFDQRIVFIGMALVPAVVELLFCELLYLDFTEPEKPIQVYINSTGSESEDGKRRYGHTTDATALVDCLHFMRPDVHTVNVGKAYGTAAMLLASGKKGFRFAMPHALTRTGPPRIARSFGIMSNMMSQANDLENAAQKYASLMAKFTGHDEQKMRKDMARRRFFSPEQALEYGLIDHVLKMGEVKETVEQPEHDYAGKLRVALLKAKAEAEAEAEAEAAEQSSDEGPDADAA